MLAHSVSTACTAGTDTLPTSLARGTLTACCEVDLALTYETTPICRDIPICNALL